MPINFTTFSLIFIDSKSEVTPGFIVFKYPGCTDSNIEKSLQSPSIYAALIKGAADHWGFENWKRNYQFDSILECFQKNYDGKLFYYLLY